VRNAQPAALGRWQLCHTRQSNDQEDSVQLSTRNQLKGTVKSVTTGTIMAEVVVDVGGQEIVAAITRGSVEQLALAEGDAVTILIKATEVMLGK
jgi:molybdopterin-binding protein